MAAIDTFKAFCPNCEAITEQWLIECDDEILINDEPVTVHLRYYVCLECGEDYEIPGADYDPLAELYEKLGLKTREDKKAFFDIHRIAFNIRQMRRWLDFPKNRNSSLNY